MKQVRRQETNGATVATKLQKQNTPYVITCDNIGITAKKIALVALTTIHKNSGGKAPLSNDKGLHFYADTNGSMVRKLIANIISNDVSGEGLDIVSALTVVLYQLVGKDLYTDYVPTDVTIEDGNGYTLLAKGKKDGKRLTIWRACLRFVNTIVFTNKRAVKATRYLEEIDDEMNVVGYQEIPDGMDIDSLDEQDWYNYVVQVLELTRSEKRVLKARFWYAIVDSDGLKEVARRACVSKSCAYRALLTIGKKYAARYQDIETYEADEMPEPPSTMGVRPSWQMLANVAIATESQKKADTVATKSQDTQAKADKPTVNNKVVYDEANGVWVTCKA